MSYGVAMELIAGRYRIDAEIGRGAASVVYRAYDERTHALCALKILRTSRVPADIWRRFAREVEIMTQLRHPHIARVYDYDLTASRPWMAMPLARAGSVHTHLVKRGPLPIGDVIVHGIEILGALQAAHRAGVIHRDIKPSNLLKTSKGLAVADFGIAALVADRSDNGALGSFGYMAPEVHLGHDGVPSDLYAVGVTLFVMATRGNPFALNDDDRDSPRLRKVPPLLRAVVYQATRPIPTDRPACPAVMAAALVDAARGTAFSSSAQAAMERSMSLADVHGPGYPGG